MVDAATSTVLAQVAVPLTAGESVTVIASGMPVIALATLQHDGSTAAAAPSIVAGYRTGGYFLEVPAGRYGLELANAETQASIATYPTGPLASGTVGTALVSDAAVGATIPLRLSYFSDLPHASRLHPRAPPRPGRRGHPDWRHRPPARGVSSRPGGRPWARESWWCSRESTGRASSSSTW